MNVLYDYRVFSGQTIIENFYPRIASRIRNIPVNASSSLSERNSITVYTEPNSC